MAQNRVNNFNFLRLIFAIFVLITHSYPLMGYPENDVFMQLTKQCSLSELGVTGFFAISGYLIYISLIRSKNLIEYFSKRVLRIFPALIVLLIITVFIWGPLITEKDAISYFGDKETWNYFFKNIFLQTQYSIDGILRNNPYPNAINGSLWTIPYEFTCYILLSILFITSTIKNLNNIILAFLFIAFLIINNFYLSLFTFWTPYFSIHTGTLLQYGGFFLMGSLIAANNEIFTKYKTTILLVSAILLIAAFSLTIYSPLKYILLPITIISLGLHSFKYIKDVSMIGDFSYGFYLYAFLIQQTIISLFELSFTLQIAVSFTFTMVLAIISWFYIEKPFLQFKRVP